MSNMKLRGRKIWRSFTSKVSPSHSEYRELNVEYRSESCFTTALTKIDTQKNKASDADVDKFWRNAVQPTFRNRRGGVDEVKLKKEFISLKRMICEKILKEYNLI